MFWTCELGAWSLFVCDLPLSLKGKEDVLCWAESLEVK